MAAAGGCAFWAFMVRKRAFLAFGIALFFPLNMRAVYRTGARGATLGDFGALARLLRRCRLLAATLYTCQARRVLAAFWRVSVAGACLLVASTYRRSYPPTGARPWFPGASIQGGVILWIRGQDMRTGGRRLPPDGIHLPPELSTCHGPGLCVQAWPKYAAIWLFVCCLSGIMIEWSHGRKEHESTGGVATLCRQ